MLQTCQSLPLGTLTRWGMSILWAGSCPSSPPTFISLWTLGWMRFWKKITIRLWSLCRTPCHQNCIVSTVEFQLYISHNSSRLRALMVLFHLLRLPASRTRLSRLLSMCCWQLSLSRLLGMGCRVSRIGERMLPTFGPRDTKAGVRASRFDQFMQSFWDDLWILGP